MSQNIEYLDAWHLWFDGDASLRGMTLWGAEIYWWGRIGKISALIAGLVILIDIVGPERIREFSKRQARNDSLALLVAILVAVMTLVLSYALIASSTKGGGALLAVIPLITLVILACVAIVAIANAVRRNKIIVAGRWASVALLIAGFHFDMLAS